MTGQHRGIARSGALLTARPGAERHQGLAAYRLGRISRRLAVDLGLGQRIERARKVDRRPCPGLGADWELTHAHLKKAKAGAVPDILDYAERAGYAGVWAVFARLGLRSDVSFPDFGPPLPPQIIP